MREKWSVEFANLCSLVDTLMDKTVRVVDRDDARSMLRIAEQKQQAVSCGNGCAACCNLLVTVSLSEVLGMLAHAGDIDTEELERQRAVVASESTTKSSYFMGRHACVFLRDGLCTVYHARPMVCRTHFVISPASNCNEDGFVKKLRAPKINRHATASIAVAELLGIPMSYAPLQVIVDMALSVSESDAPKKRLWEFATLHGMDELEKSARKWLRHG